MNSARELTSRLADLLRREHGALGDFLVVLSDFDRCRVWEELGHPSLFQFLRVELGLSKGAAHYRKVAAELVQRCPVELHHVVACALGGRATIENLSLRCRFHNDLEARDDFGDAFMNRFTRRRTRGAPVLPDEPELLRSM